MASTLPLPFEGGHNLLRKLSQRVHRLFVRQTAKGKRSDEAIAAGDLEVLPHLLAYAVSRSGNIETFGAARFEIVEIVLPFVVASLRLQITGVLVEVRQRRFRFFPRRRIAGADIDVSRDAIQRLRHMRLPSLSIGPTLITETLKQIKKFRDARHRLKVPDGVQPLSRKP